MPTTRLELPGEQTLIESWRALAQSSPGASVTRTAHAIVAAFPAWADLNNAIACEGSDRASADAAAAEATAMFASAGIDRWGLWIPSDADDLDAPDRLHELSALRRDATSLVMRATLSGTHEPHDAVVRTSAFAAAHAGDEPIVAGRLPPPDESNPLRAWVLVEHSLAVAGAWSVLRDGDCGVYAVGTAPGWRRRGLARALVEHVLADAMERGATTATLQSTRMGQQLYRSLGFVPVGRYEEWRFGESPPVDGI